MTTKRQPEDDFEKMLRKFRTWLEAARLTKQYVDDLVKHVRRGYEDPIAYLATIHTNKTFIKARQAWLHWCDWTGSDELERQLHHLRAPRAIPGAPRVLPTDDQLRQAAEDAAGLPMPAGPLLWILYLSGLRIGEVCQVARVEAQDALQTSEVTIRQKGAGGIARRTWVPGGLVRMALGPLLSLPWRATWVLVGGNPQGAQHYLRRRVAGAFHPHDFRHAVARLVRRLTGRAEVVSAVLGHDLRSIMGSTAFYAPPAPEELEQAHAAVAAHLWPNGIPAPEGSWLRLPVPKA